MEFRGRLAIRNSLLFSVHEIIRRNIKYQIWVASVLGLSGEAPTERNNRSAGSQRNMSIFNGSLFVSSIVQNNPSPNSNKKQNYNPTWRRRSAEKNAFWFNQLKFFLFRRQQMENTLHFSAVLVVVTMRHVRALERCKGYSRANNNVCIRLRELLNNRNKFSLDGKHVRTASATC